MRILVEVCVDSLESARCAVEKGADRLEICANLAVGGGTSPSMGLVRAIMDRLPSMPLMVMVRPRIGSFVYLPDEVETMEAEVKNLREFVSARRLVIGDDERIKGEDRSGGVQGIVIGALTPNGGVDLSTMTRMIKVAGDGMTITFHRAFDMALDQSRAYAEILSLGNRITRILTSAGSISLGKVGALESLTKLRDLQLDPSTRNQYPIQPTLMPGSGVGPEVIPKILDVLLPVWKMQESPFEGEIHLSGGQWYLPSPQDEAYVDPKFMKKGMGFGLARDVEDEMRNWGRWRVVGTKLQAVRIALDQYGSTV